MGSHLHHSPPKEHDAGYPFCSPNILLLHHPKVFLMHPTDGDGIAGEVHDELTVTVDADYVAFETSEEAGEDAETNVVTSEFFKRITQEGDRLGV